jgi:uncharacterized protein YeeX (DUF496 family)
MLKKSYNIYRNKQNHKKSKRPKKITTLENYLHTHFAKNISMDKIKTAIECMKEDKNIIIINNKINYNNI